MPTNSRRSYRAALAVAGLILILISNYYLVVAPPVAVHTGPNPADTMAAFRYRSMINYMVYIPMLALGIMWIIRGIRKPAR